MTGPFRRFVVAGSLILALSMMVTESRLAGAQEPADRSEEIKALIKKLDSNRFADRNEGTQKLSAMGEAAIDSLKEAAKSESSEVATRSIQILQRHLESSDDALKAAAKAALESLAEGDDDAASRAKDALKPNTETPRPPALPGMRIGGGNIQIQFRGAAGNRKVRVKQANGVKETDVEENGEKIKIVEDPANGIKVEVTKKDANGNEVTKKYEAKNLDDLKKNEPEAYKIYEKHGKQQGMNIRVQQGFPNIKPGVIPPPPGFQAPNPIQRINRFDPKRVAEEIKSARSEIRELIEQSKEVTEKGSDGKELLLDLADRLEKAEKKLEEAMNNLGPFGR